MGLLRVALIRQHNTCRELGDPLSKLGSADAELLKVPFIEEEIQRELMGTDDNKVPGSNGFTFKFAQFFSDRS